MPDVLSPEAANEPRTPPGGGEPPRPPTGEGVKSKKKRRRKKKIVKAAVAVVITLAALGGIALGLRRLLRESEPEVELLTDFVTRGSIQSMVTGSGLTRAKESASLVLASGGVVGEVFVQEGDLVAEGDPLYAIDSADAKKTVDEAEKTVEDAQKAAAATADEIEKLLEQYNDLTVVSPHSGVLLETARLRKGDSVAAGTKIATLVDESVMLLTLYFSYAYERDIAVGQPAVVSIPSSMSEIPGAVREVNYIRRISAEGAALFQVVVEMNNPGALTAEMAASAVLTSGAGERVYPYEGGALEYSRVTDIVTKVAGDVIEHSLMDYARASEGQTLLLLDSNVNDAQIESLRKQLETQQKQAQTAAEAVEKARKDLDDLNAFAPMGGTVMACSLKPGEKVEQGRAALTVANTTVMLVEARIDEMNVQYVKTGMYCDITQWGRNGQEMFGGVVESISLEGKNENGYSYFPATVRVDNADGKLLSSMYVDYSLVASQSDDCLTVPIQAIKYTEAGSCVFVRLDGRPENALNAEELGLDVPDGFYAIPVTVGLSANSMAEILDGVEEGAEVFTQYLTNRGDSYSGGGVSIMRG
ncbi:MAG: HlyD family efflux transporter periplasmic adaptor subunit [Oscillospiraceae bacterium]|jgi:multidrug efflux pump subunit AcrA (membrane-fusion protein)|nr:HlyD family efflux transporter periplasmic adaptor subunit [Oscillospiraceae bacterium]